MGVEHVYADMLTVEKGVAGSDQKRPRKQIPLHLQKAIGAVVEGLANDGVEGADDRGSKYQPDGVFADQGVESVYDPR